MRLTDEHIEHLDQFIYRFTKLQDSMGTRLLPSLHRFFENSSQPIPFLDILNRFELERNKYYVPGIP